MKVLQVLPTLSAGGAEGFVTNLGVSLGELGAEVRFFLLAGVRGEWGQVLFLRLREAGIDVIGAGERNIRSPKNLIRLARLTRSWRPDIVQANLYSTEVVVAVARILSIGSGACYVRRLANTEQAGYRSTTVVRMMDRFFRLTIANASAVEDAFREFMRDKNRSAIATIPNGGFLLETVPDAQEKHDARRAIGVPETAFVVTHIGRMFGADRANTSLQEGQKAQDVLLKSFARAFCGNAEKILVLVGDGPLRPQAEALARNLGIAEQTRFLGQQPEPWPALKAADMFCFPSRHEGLPNVLPEAASCGLPVVASDIREIRSLYPGDAWLLKPVDDVEAFAEGLRTVRADSELFVSRAREAAQGFREEFSMRTCAEKYRQAYESALGWNKKNRD